jgi:hypothetical protein
MSEARSAAGLSLQAGRSEKLPRPPIGGFFELDLGPPIDARAGTSVAASWFGTASEVVAFRNARSALALGVLPALPASQLWLPDFICPELRRAVAPHIALRSYPLAADGPLAPDSGFLAAHVEPGDAVLVVSYFGRAPSSDLRAYAARRPDVTWIEDRAGAFDPGPAWGDIVLHSARKLLGVPDGGFASVPAQRRPRRLERPVEPAEEVYPPCLARYEDTCGLHNAAWYAAYRSAEDKMRVEARAASRLALGLLDRLDFEGIATRRRRNYQALLSALPPRVVLEGFERECDGVPQGVPVLVPDAPHVVATMARARIFCARYWPDMPAVSSCSRTADLRDRLMLLPCDQRFEPDEMVRVAEAFHDALAIA